MNLPITHTPIRKSRGFAPEAIGHARRRYEDTDETQDSIATDLGVSRRTLGKLAKSQGWKLRKDRPPRDLPPALRLELEATHAIATPEASNESGGEAAALVAPSVADRLEQAVEKELRKVESLRSQFGNPAHRSIEAERTARTLATLTETLFKVRRLREPGSNIASHDDDLPGDTDGFRLALATRIDAFVRSRTDAGVSGANEPADAGPAQS